MSRLPLYSLVALAMTGAAAVAAPCVTDTFDVGLPGAEDVRTRYADVPAVQFPGTWQEGSILGYGYRLFSNGDAELTPLTEAADWRIDFHCTEAEGDCRFSDTGAPPELAGEIARVIGRCLMGQVIAAKDFLPVPPKVATDPVPIADGMPETILNARPGPVAAPSLSDPVAAPLPEADGPALSDPATAPQAEAQLPATSDQVAAPLSEAPAVALPDPVAVVPPEAALPGLPDPVAAPLPEADGPALSDPAAAPQADAQMPASSDQVAAPLPETPAAALPSAPLPEAPPDLADVSLAPAIADAAVADPDGQGAADNAGKELCGLAALAPAGQIETLQGLLDAAGVSPGGIDGVAGPRTKRALTRALGKVSEKMSVEEAIQSLNTYLCR